MPESINSKLKEQYDHDDSGGSLDTNLGDFLDSEGASGTSNNSKWRNWASGTGTSLNTRLFHKHGGSGSFMTRWKNWIAFSSTHSFNFDGNDNYIEAQDTLESVFQASYSISLWLKADDGQPSSDQSLFGVRTSANSSINNVVRGMIKTNGKLFFTYQDGLNDAPAETYSAVFSDGATDWTHVAIVVSESADQIYIYVNGSVQTLHPTYNGDTSALTFSNFGTSNNFPIGGRNNLGTVGQFFSGKIDEVAIWDTALSASDVTSIYNNGKVIDLSKSASYGTDRTGNLKLWLRCGDKAEPESTTAIARQDFYTDFDGTDDYVSIADDNSLDQTSALTIVCWAKNANSGLSATELLVAKYTSTGSDNRSYAFEINSSEKLVFTASADGTSSLGTQTSDSALSTINEWHHYAVTFSSGTCKLFQDGVEIASTASNMPSSIYAGASTLLIGAINTGTLNWEGAISNVSVYQTALDAQTISQMAKSRFTPMRDNRFSVVSLDGTNDFIDCGNDSSLQFSGSFSIGCWFRTTDATATNEILISKSDDGVSAGWLIRLNSSRKLDFTYTNSASGGVGATISDTGSVVNDGQWYHVMFVHESGVGNRAYKNGVLVGSNSTGTDLGSHTPNFHIGNQDYTTARALACDVSSASAYNVAKSTEEVYAIYQQGITYDESSLNGIVGYWRMGDGTGDTFKYILDQSSNSNNGAMTNMTRSDISEQMVAGYDLGAFTNSTESTLENVYNSDMSLSTTPSFNGVDFSYYSNTSSAQETSTIGGRTNVWKIVTASDDTYSAVRFIPNPNQDISNKQFNISVKVYIPSTDGVPSVRLRYVYDSGGNNTIIATTTTTDEWVTLSTSSPVTIADYNGWSLNIEFVSSGVANKICYIDDFSITSVLQSEVSDSYPAIIDVNEPVLGVDQVTNGTFDADSNWTKGTGWSIGSGVASCDGTQTGNTGLIQQGTISGANLDFEVGKTYKITFDVTTTAGAITYIEIGGTTEHTDVPASDSTATRYIQASSTNDRLTIAGNSSFVGTVDNVVVKEVHGNVGTMTNQDSSDLVYSSVLPDQSFLTGVNSAYNFIDLDGTNEYIDCGDINEIDGASALSISAWIKCDVTSGAHVIVSKYSSSSVRTELIISSNVLYMAFGATNGNFSFTSTDWNHVAMVFDGSGTGNTGRLKIYLNGENQTLSYTGTIGTTTPDTGTNVLKIGNRTSHHFDGAMGQVSIFNKSLSATEVSAIYTAGRHSNLLHSYSDNLVGYWAMSALDGKTGLSDVGDGTIYDRSGNSNHGTATNTESADLKSSPNAESNGYAKGDTNRSTTTP